MVGSLHAANNSGNTTSNNVNSRLQVSNTISTELSGVLDRWNKKSRQNPRLMFMDFVRSEQVSQKVRREARDFINLHNKRWEDREDRGADCICNISYVPSDDTPEYKFVDEYDVFFTDTGGHEWLYDKELSRNGAAHSGHLANEVKHNIWGAGDPRTDESTISVRMDCFGSNGSPCSEGAQACSGQLNFIVDYGSQVDTIIDAGGVLNGRIAIASDSVSLTYENGYGASEILYNKGVAASINKSTEVDPESLVTFSQGVIGLAEVLSSDDFSFAEIDEAMLSNLIYGSFGLIKREGNSGESPGMFLSTYESGLGEDYILAPGILHKLTLKSHADSFTRGWGGFNSYGKASYGSSFYIAATANNFVCEENALPPNDNFYWSYANLGGPNSHERMSNEIISYLDSHVTDFRKDKSNLVKSFQQMQFVDPNYDVFPDAGSVRIRSVHLDQCIYPHAWGDIETARFHHWTCWYPEFSPSKAFKMLGTGIDGVTKFKSELINACIMPESTSDSAQMTTDNCGSVDDEGIDLTQYALLPVGGEPDHYLLRNIKTNKCLYVTNADGDMVKQRACSLDAPDMVFTFDHY